MIGELEAPTMVQNEMLPEELLNTIKARRTLKPQQFTGRQIERRVIEDMLESANWAPTYNNTEPWRFSVYDREGKRILANARAEFIEKNGGMDIGLHENTRSDLIAEADRCTYIITLGMKRHPDVPLITEQFGTACAIQNMLLMATTHRVGVKWSYGGRDHSDDLKEYLGLVPRDALFGFLLIGTVEEWPDGERESGIESKVRWVSGD